MKQTILGSGGSIGNLLAPILKREYQAQVRLVGRNPKQVNGDDELIKGDLLNATEVDKAVKGSQIVYLLVGLPYSYKEWKEKWPKVMENTINACINHNSKLVFFDNVYMYDLNSIGNMTEESPINPPSKKGLVREEIVKMLWEAIENKGLKALIARSADFYGPGIERNSVVNEMVLKNLSAGKKANWLSDINKVHSFTYTPDAAKATAILGNDDSAYGQAWHLPTATNPWTGKEIIEKSAEFLGVKAGIQVASKGIVRLMGIFIPIMRALPEMMYQYDREYVFLSDKFNRKYDFTPTSYDEGFREIAKEFKVL